MNHTTPAPWKARPLDTIVNKNRTCTAFVGEEIGFNFVKVTAAGAYAKEEAEANAHLIAAAPELLEAAESVETMYIFWKSHFPNDITLDPYLEKARAAIAKAKGTS